MPRFCHRYQDSEIDGTKLGPSKWTSAGDGVKDKHNTELGPPLRDVHNSGETKTPRTARDRRRH